MSFTASREDFRLYLTCPRKLALRTLGVKVRERRRASSLQLSNPIGVFGERLTEEVLEIIASLQIDRSRGEYIEVYKERNEDVERAMKMIVETLSTSKEAHIEDETLRRGVEPIVESTIRETFNRIGELSSFDLKSYKEEMKKGFLNILKSMLDRVPKVLAVYKPVLRNRDTCSLGYPDYQVETEKGHLLMEVKNIADLNRAIHEAKDNLLYYNSLLADRELGDSVWWRRPLPSPTRSLIVIPRQGVVKEILESILNFREIAVEIWKIKRAALVDGVLPDVKRVPSICRRCAYEKICRKMRGEQVEAAKPLPLIYAVARCEVEEVEGRGPSARLDLPPGFLGAYFELELSAMKGDEEARNKLKKMNEYLKRISLNREDKCKALYRVVPDEFDSWGGLDFLKNNYSKIESAASKLYFCSDRDRNDAKVILKVAGRRWGIGA